jgi:hypothetical protein
VGVYVCVCVCVCGFLMYGSFGYMCTLITVFIVCIVFFYCSFMYIFMMVYLYTAIWLTPGKLVNLPLCVSYVVVKGLSCYC